MNWGHEGAELASRGSFAVAFDGLHEQRAGNVLHEYLDRSKAFSIFIAPARPVVTSLGGHTANVSPDPRDNNEERRLRRDLTFAMDRKGIDDEDAHHDVGERPDRVVGHPPDGADGHHCPSEDTDPSTDL